MPWSEWITSEPEPNSVIYMRGISTKRHAVTGNDTLGTVIGDVRDDMRAGSPVVQGTLVQFTDSVDEIADTFEVASEIEAEPGWYQAEGTLTQRDWWVSTTEKFAPMGGLANLRQWSPPELDDLEYGVDYGPRPDRDEDEDLDAYVQYDEGDAVRVGWQGIAQLSFWDSDPDDSSVTAALRLESWSPPNLPDPFPGEADEFWWSQISAITGLPVGGSFLGGYSGFETDTPDGPIDFSSLLPDQEEFAVVLATPVFPPEAFGGFPPGYVYLRRQAVKALVDVSALIQYPRWRYWIPGRLPLRQRQRDDSLALGSPRQGKKTSRQGSIRQRGYL